MTLTPNDALIYQAQQRPRDTAFVFHDVVWTYQKLAVETDRLARALAARGVGPGDRVAIHMTNRPEFIVAYHACFRLGAIAAPLRNAFTSRVLGSILKRVAPAIYLGEAGLYANVASTDATLLPAERRFVLGGTSDDPGFRPWEALFTGSQDAVIFPPEPDQPCVLIATAGTTGQPKLVMHTPSTLRASVGLMRLHWDFSERDTVTMSLPFGNLSGLISMACYLQLGAPFIVLESFDAGEVLDTMERHGATVYLGYPEQYAALIEAQQKHRRDLGTLRFCLSGGDACPVTLQEQATAQFGAPLCNLWGASEVLGQLTFGLRPGPVIRVIEGAEVRLIDEQGDDVAEGEVGELLIRGGNVFVGYWNDARATAEALRDGWYHTGDLLRRGEADELWFVARKQDIIVRGNASISPIEVEEAIVAAHPSVEIAAVVGVPDEALGHRVFAFATLTDDTPSDRVMPELVARLGQLLAGYEMPEAILVVDRMPRNALSRVDRQKLLLMAIEAERYRRTRLITPHLIPVMKPAHRLPLRTAASH